jgi:aminoglycoside 2''-phosphotransferase
MATQRYVQAIQTIYPDFQIRTVKCLNLGQNNDVLLINEDLIFRFPKYEDGMYKLQSEVRILKAIRDRVSIRVPHPIYEHFDSNQLGRVFVGYKKIPGEPLWRSSIHQTNVYKLAKQLSRFLEELHIISPVVSVGERVDGYAKWSNLYDRIKIKLFPYMRKDAKKWVETHFDTFLSNTKNFAVNPVLIHGDFGATNILYDSKSDSITGIIDFGSAGLGDPAIDYASLSASYGDSFFHLLFEQNKNILQYTERIKFYIGTFALQEALFGLENNDTEAFRNGIEMYK